MKGCVWQRPQPFLHQAWMVTGLFDSSMCEIGSAGYIWTYGYMQRRQGHRNRKMDGQNRRGLETRGAADGGRLVGEGVGGWVRVGEEHSQSGED